MLKDIFPLDTYIILILATCFFIIRMHLVWNQSTTGMRRWKEKEERQRKRENEGEIERKKRFENEQILNLLSSTYLYFV